MLQSISQEVLAKTRVDAAENDIQNERQSLCSKPETQASFLSYWRTASHEGPRTSAHRRDGELALQAPAGAESLKLPTRCEKERSAFRSLDS